MAAMQSPEEFLRSLVCL